MVLKLHVPKNFKVKEILTHKSYMSEVYNTTEMLSSIE